MNQMIYQQICVMISEEITRELTVDPVEMKAVRASTNAMTDMKASEIAGRIVSCMTESRDWMLLKTEDFSSGIIVLCWNLFT